MLQQKLVGESDAHFTGLPVGTALSLIVTAINEAGESQPSAPFVFTLI